MHGKPYAIFKIRTMRNNCERHSGPKWSTPGDSRITPIGRFLRASHLDELPQLWNVLRGEMSLIGPRPERPELIPELQREVPNYRDCLLVRPGVTGLAQIQLPSDTDLNSVHRKIKYDLYYVRRVSAWLDVRILFCTVFHLLGVPARFSRKILLGRDGESLECDIPLRLARATRKANLV